MEYGEKILSGSGEMELDPNIVSEEAGKLYSELQVRLFIQLGDTFLSMFFQHNNLWRVLYLIDHSAQTIIETHGEGVVESLVPVFVWVLEGLASCKAQLRDREEEAERERAEREELLERYQAERTLRKESQEVQRDLFVLGFFATSPGVWLLSVVKVGDGCRFWYEHWDGWHVGKLCNNLTIKIILLSFWECPQVLRVFIDTLKTKIVNQCFCIWKSFFIKHYMWILLPAAVIKTSTTFIIPQAVVLFFILQRCLELDDQIEQERRAMKGREKERERRARDLEKKAREQADQCEYRNIVVIFSSFIFAFPLRAFQDSSSMFYCFVFLLFCAVVALEEQRANLNRELSTLRHTHNKVRLSVPLKKTATVVSPSIPSIKRIKLLFVLYRTSCVLSFSWLTHIGNLWKEKWTLKRILLQGCFSTVLGYAKFHPCQR